jgi:hypothetical protein
LTSYISKVSMALISPSIISARNTSDRQGIVLSAQTTSKRESNTYRIRRILRPVSSYISLFAATSRGSPILAPPEGARYIPVSAYACFCMPTYFSPLRMKHVISWYLPFEVLCLTKLHSNSRKSAAK